MLRVWPAVGPRLVPDGLMSRGYGASVAGRLRMGVFPMVRKATSFLRSPASKTSPFPICGKQDTGSRGSSDRGTFLERPPILPVQTPTPGNPCSMAGEAGCCGVWPAVGPDSSHGLTSRGYGASVAWRSGWGVFPMVRKATSFLRSPGLKDLTIPNLRKARYWVAAARQTVELSRTSPDLCQAQAPTPGNACSMAGEAGRCGVWPAVAPDSSHGLTSRGYGASLAWDIEDGGCFPWSERRRVSFVPGLKDSECLCRRWTLDSVNAYYTLNSQVRLSTSQPLQHVQGTTAPPSASTGHPSPVNPTKMIG